MRIVCLALTPLTGDARVQRTASALTEAGHDVVVVARPPLPEAAGYACEPLDALPRAAMERLELVLRHAPATIWPALAPYLAWVSRTRVKALNLAVAAKPDVVIANDWLTLPVGAAVKRRLGARLVYDSHELATREHVQNWKWRLVSRRTVAEIERRNIAHADLVLTVSDGIADSLQQLYRLKARPVVVRNLPRYQAVRFRGSSWPIAVLFHGLIRQERGLEELIDSMPSWTVDARLEIRGYGQERYLAALRSHAAGKGVAERVAFLPRVSPDELVARAASSDVGYLALPATTEHYEHALPNKLFEYLMAGLAVLATPRAEIARLVAGTGAGVLTGMSPAALAATINGLSLEGLDRMRGCALEAARRLSWEHEKERLVDALDGVARRKISASADS